MVIADTSIWIEFLKDNSLIYESFLDLLGQQKIFALEWIFGELFQGARGKRERTILKEYWVNMPKVSQPDIWIQAGEVSGQNKWPSKGIGLIDAAIIVAAKKSGAKIWSLDKKLLSVLPKSEIFTPHLHY